MHLEFVSELKEWGWEFLWVGGGLFPVRSGFCPFWRFIGWWSGSLGREMTPKAGGRTLIGLWYPSLHFGCSSHFFLAFYCFCILVAFILPFWISYAPNYSMLIILQGFSSYPPPLSSPQWHLTSFPRKTSPSPLSSLCLHFSALFLSSSGMLV